jgi:hypothetical protein
MLDTIKELPKIGENIERFIVVFGTQAKESSDTLYLFDVEGITPRLQCAVNEGRVYNISWSLPYGIEKVREVALRFMPVESYIVSEGVFEVKPMLNGDVPVKEDLYEIRGSEEEVFFGVGEDSTFTIHLDI